MKLLVAVLFTCVSLSAAAQYNFYFGNIHAHSGYSDGAKDAATTGVFTPGASYNFAKSTYHFDFLGIAEHNHFSSTNNPGMHVADYPKGLYQADTANANGTFVAMYGMEWGTISSGGHVITYGIPLLVGWETLAGAPNYGIYCAKGDFTSYWNICRQYPNSFTTLAHPETDDYGSILTTAAFNSKADSSICGLAVRSGGAFSQTTNYTDAPATSYEYWYRVALAKGYHVGPAIDHDNHYTTFGRTTQGRTVVLAKSLHRDSLYAAYKARRFYASDDWNTEVNFAVNGQVMGEVATTSTNAVIGVSWNDPDPGDQSATIRIFSGVYGSGAMPSLLIASPMNNFSTTDSIPLGTTKYYYAQIVQADGNIIWTAPVWLKRVSAGSNPVPVPSPASPAVSRPEFVVYPSPFQNDFTIRLPHDKIETATVNIYDLQGRRVWSEKRSLQIGSNQLSVNASTLAKGIYLVTVQVENKRLIDTRIIKG